MMLKPPPNGFPLSERGGEIQPRSVTQEEYLAKLERKLQRLQSSSSGSGSGSSRGSGDGGALARGSGEQLRQLAQSTVEYEHKLRRDSCVDDASCHAGTVLSPSRPTAQKCLDLLFDDQADVQSPGTLIL